MASPPVTEYSPSELVDEIVAATREYEFDTFVLGIERPPDYQRELHESAYRQLKVEVGTKLSELWPHRAVDFERPDLRIDLARRAKGLRVLLQPVPLFIGGRYLKLSREIPACRWMHMACKGKGCRSCGFTGNICGPSIQELSDPAVLAATAGSETFFHGAGREDIDVRMLGTGRPFVIEVRHPKRRSFDPETLCSEINAAARGYAEVHRLALTTRAAMVAAKSAAAEKTYRARIRFEGDVPDDIESRLTSLRGAEIAQLSPTRVMKRRGRKTVRHKRVIGCALIDHDGGEYVWEVRTSSGTYIKELVSGDDGRTVPSVASIVGVPCECVALDVLGVHWRPPWESVERDAVADDDVGATSEE